MLAPQLQRLTVATHHRHGDVTPQSAAVAALAAALSERQHRITPDAAASRALHMTTNLVSKQGAEDVIWALGRVGVWGTRVVHGTGGYYSY